MGRGSEKVEQPRDEGGAGGRSAIDEDNRAEVGRRPAGQPLLPASPGTCWGLLGKSLSLSGPSTHLENVRLEEMISRGSPSEVAGGAKLASKRGDGWE